MALIIDDIHAAVEPRTERRIIAANRVITAINANHAALDVALATIGPDADEIVELRREIDIPSAADPREGIVILRTAAKRVLDAIESALNAAGAIDTTVLVEIPAETEGDPR